MEEELEIDPQQLAMTQVIAVLTPLRQHRQASAERAQRRAQRALDELHAQLQATREALSQERANQRERRQALSQANLNQAMALNDLERWHEKEHRMLDRLAYIRQDVERQRLGIDAQQQLLEQARAEAKASQRAVEKLACLAEALDEQG
ncbi:MULTISPECIES: YscO family type III secretion system apparatus protein [unclassified Pseudomonas]|uniref:YscO family type III secretion system apparatus protein n=1 Tax=unclassified Pseudomonas TaxID=196821 RepID=UPI000D347CBD|nr:MULTISPECIES: YscO family type III secretion system apparatus protein [unclassified Pseudomonas]RAU38189.1 type III secretion protein [Pseudomonas sp. RIT 409]RAU45054.1 type III secretion protein [Pseudomonas sp. RIT 412]